VQGDDQNAVVVTDKSTVWNEARKLCSMTKEQEAKMQKHYREWIESLAHGFGFKAHVEIGVEGNSSKITFSRK
jgi:hypothetical protein